MSIANCADLKAAIAAFLNRANLSAQIPGFIQLAETRIAYGSREGQFLCEPLRVRGMESSADVAISAQTAGLPAGYLQARRFYLNSDPIQELGYVVPDLFWRTYISVCAGRPTRFTVEGENFVFGPAPDGAYTGKILYYQKFAPLVNDGDTNWLLTNAPGVYLHGALLEAYRFTRNMDKAADEHGAFCGAVNALNLADKADRYSGSPWQAFGDTGESMKRIALAKWQPDMMGLANLGQSDTRNVYATGSGYAPLRGLSALSTSGLNAAAIGAISAQDSTGTTNTFAGDAAKLYRLSAGVFSDVSKAGGYTALERWEFVQYGQRVIAAEIGAPVQYYDLAASSLFADLAGGPPQARHAAVVRDFVVLGNTTNSPNEVAWSGFNDSEGWTSGVNQSDSQILQGGGWVQAIAGGEVGYVFQERAITRMTYVGPPVYFQFDAIEQARGLMAPGALIQVGALIYYLAQDGFYVFDGTQSVSIGNQKVDGWFAAHLQPNTGSLISAGIDPVSKLVFWSFVSTDATHPDTLLIFNWMSQDWSYAKLDHEMVYPGLSEGWTLEQIGAVYASIEDVPVSLDSRVWTGGSAYLAAFDTSHRLASFEGDTLAASMQTGDFEGVAGHRSLITNLRPLSDAGAMTAICRSRERFADSVTDTDSASLQSNGDIPLLSSGRFHQAALSVPAAADWSFANGVDVDAGDDSEI